MKSLLFTLALLGTAFAQTTFTLGEGTEARFYIDEILLGQDKTVLGATRDVAGEVTLDPVNPQAAELGTLTIDARTLSTDDNRRNRQIQTRILESNQDEFRFITFEPVSVAGLPGSLTVGDNFSVEVTGNLTIRGVTRKETFAVTLTLASETELQGLGSAVINHADYNLNIPNVPSVARVGNEVTLELAFTALAQ